MGQDVMAKAFNVYDIIMNLSSSQDKFKLLGNVLYVDLLRFYTLCLFKLY